MAHHDSVEFLDMPPLLNEDDAPEEDPEMPALLDPDMPALLDDRTSDVLQDTVPGDEHSAVYHSYPPVDFQTLLPDMHVPVRNAFDWVAFLPFYIELEKSAQASQIDALPFHVEIEKLIVELAPDEQVRQKLLEELFPQTP
jgi:hypothetical protein